MSDDAGVRIRRSARHAKRLETAPSMAHALLSLVALTALFVDVVAAGAEHNKHATSFDQVQHTPALLLWLTHRQERI